MKYTIPKNKIPKNDMVKSVMFRLPIDLYEPFNQALKESDMSAQALVEDMVRFCLQNTKENQSKKREGEGNG